VQTWPIPAQKRAKVSIICAKQTQYAKGEKCHKRYGDKALQQKGPPAGLGETNPIKANIRNKTNEIRFSPRSASAH